ncbi:type IX secretion system motor protein PorM/GldM [Moheibacter sediminis]|uniref:Gliding motility-associated protein GldM n=1 Tax=Moheibacter sediminis TaxID=1434700 RepID=A0A1W1ZU94_9FLAO|nr:gliding motility protein GldM [Moheibacter sediminis]SMC51658.1 gliding motility-associated protein GldM [Moheibacter sediminis]
MAQGKQSPRQKMINLMYLIFIAMMAMQVDRQVLRSFEDITVTLNESSKLTDENNTTFYDQIVKKASEDPDYAAIQGKADQVKAEADKAFNAIDALKNKIMQTQAYQLPAIGATEEHETNYASLSNVDAVTNLLFISDDKPKPEAEGLKSAVDNFKTFMATAYADSDRDKKRVEQIFNTSDRGKKSWLNSLFYGQPLIAGLANLTKLQSDIRTEEGNLVRTLLSNKLEDEIELKAFQPIVMVPPIMRAGKPVEASIAFGAFDNTLQGSVSVGGQNVTLKDGKAVFNITPTGSGMKTISGTMSYKANGKDVSMPFTQQYEVVAETIPEPPSGAIITADKMNVVYRGLDNPISATVNGAEGAISLTASVGGLSGSNGKYNFKPAAGSGTVTFTASAKTSSGKTVSGKKEFRIKPVPPARGNILNKTSITVPANGLAAQTVRVDWPDFLFDLTANVNSFKVKVPGQPTASVTGNKMSAASGVLSKARKGDAVFVFDIKYSSGSISGEASPVTIEVQ